jgi:Ca2+/Na+ antiporter
MNYNEIKEEELIKTEKFSSKQLNRYIWFCKIPEKMLTENFFWVISAIPFILFPSVFIWLGFFELNVMTIFLFTIVHFLFWIIKGRKEALKVINETLPELEILIEVLKDIRNERNG